jgi:hypothetical protein
VKRLALESLVDGCIEEGAAARSAEEAARRTEDPAIREVLLRIAREEARHAELARCIVAWALSVEPSLRDGLSAQLEILRKRISPRTTPLSAVADLGRYGRLDRASLEALKVEACAKALCETRDKGMRSDDLGVL